MYQGVHFRILGLRSTISGGEHDNQGFEGSGPMIRIGSVVEASQDASTDTSQIWLPRPRPAAENDTAAHPPAA
jgi:hypothetical protein